MYPNPTNDIVKVESDGKIIQIKLYDMQGKLLTVVKNTNEISLKNYDTGVYKLIVENENHNFVTQRIVVLD